ncbi:ROK family transcriptional regulator [uncultured Schumannella sp.]|uniref:ROK family transcriptional regulator n=1 Tax=uncultured Schumannella sp. TaxID=1195956 RepID=UPI000E84878C|nr:ROK family transcriptional regulator [uncultured Schumannella sp.]HBS75634.1 sugar kinase [Microbacterium sp.]
MNPGPGQTLRLIRSGEATTRGALLAATGLSRVTVARRIEKLTAAGIIREAGTGDATGGRRATTFIFDPDVVVVTAALDAVGGTVAVVSPHGKVLASTSIDTDVTDGPEATLSTTAAAIEELMRTHDVAVERVAAVAISLPGPIDPAEHRLSDPPIMPGWDGWPILDSLRETMNVPVFVENDADAMAYGEASQLHGPTAALVFIKASSFLGAGLVIRGEIFRGVDGGAGDIGHVSVGGAAECRCGRDGCLAAEASGTALIRRLGETGRHLEHISEIHDLVDRGDSTAAAELRRAGELIGQVLATVVGVINPAVVVVGGPMVSPELIAAIRSTVYAGTLPRATRHLTIRASELGDEAALIGLALVAVDSLYSESAINARLGVDE